MSRLTLALSPATLPKTGSLYDIALACAVLSAGRKKPWHRLEKTVLLGELQGERSPAAVAARMAQVVADEPLARLDYAEAVDPATRITDIHLVRKEGGKSGVWTPPQ